MLSLSLLSLVLSNIQRDRVSPVHWIPTSTLSYLLLLAESTNCEGSRELNTLLERVSSNDLPRQPAAIKRSHFYTIILFLHGFKTLALHRLVLGAATLYRVLDCFCECAMALFDTP